MCTPEVNDAQAAEVKTQAGFKSPNSCDLSIDGLIDDGLIAANIHSKIVEQSSQVGPS